MNTWLLCASAALGVIAAVHSVMGERRIFRPWAVQSPAGVKPFHQRILRASWHLPSLLGLGQAGLLAVWGAVLVLAALLLAVGALRVGAP